MNHIALIAYAMVALAVAAWLELLGLRAPIRDGLASVAATVREAFAWLWRTMLGAFDSDPLAGARSVNVEDIESVEYTTTGISPCGNPDHCWLKNGWCLEGCAKPAPKPRPRRTRKPKA